MSQLVRILNGIVFFAVTVVIAVFFYKGMAGGEIPSFTNVALNIMDVSFIISTLINLFYFSKNKLIFGFSFFSALLIVAAVVMMFASIGYPMWTLFFWDLYLWLYYGWMVAGRAWRLGASQRQPMAEA